MTTLIFNLKMHKTYHLFLVILLIVISSNCIYAQPTSFVLGHRTAKPTIQNGINGYGANYAIASTYNLNFGYTALNTPSTLDSVRSFVVGGNTYNYLPSILSTPYSRVIVNRKNNSTITNPNKFTGFFENNNLSGNTSSGPVYYTAEFTNDVSEIVNSYIINRGSDNFFSNTGGSTVNNIERVDLIFESGVKSISNPANIGMLLMERGGNDGYKVAAITELNQDGTVKTLGTLASKLTSSWGASGKSITSTVFQNDNASGGNNAIRPDQNLSSQNISGSFVTLQELGIPVGTVIYGLALFPDDVTAGMDLVGLTNVPLTTSAATGAGAGGLDFMGGGGFFYGPGEIPVAPVAVNDQSLDNSSGAVTLNVISNDTDINGDVNDASVDLNTATAGQQTTRIVSGEGTWTVDDLGNVTFTPEPGFIGSPTPINYYVKDFAGLQSNAATITITYNHPPLANNDAGSVNEDATLTVVAPGLLTNDTDFESNALTVSAIRTGTEAGSGTSGTIGSSLTGTYGTLTLAANGSYTYTADQTAADALAPGVTANDTFTYTLRDSKGGTDLAQLVITITGVNDPPIAVDDSYSMQKNATLTVLPLTADSDIDNGTLTITSINGVTLTPGTAQSITVPHGTLNITIAGAISFIPTTDYVGNVTFPYVISDGQGGSATANEIIDISAPVLTVCAWRSVKVGDWQDYTLWEALDCATDTWVAALTPPSNDRPIYVRHLVDINVGNDVVADSLTIESTGKLQVCGTLQIDNQIVFEVNKYGVAGQLDNRCGNVGCTVDVRNSATVIVRKTFDTNPAAYAWSYISLPFSVASSNIYIANTATHAVWGDLTSNTGDFYIGLYDGQKRANDGLTNGSNYVNLPAHAIVANKGYILAAGDNGSSIDFKSTPGTDFICQTTEIPTSNYISTTGKTTCDEGWNLVGVPFVSGYNLNNAQPMNPYYVWNGSSYTTVMADDNYTIYPFSSFFAQDKEAGTGIIFDNGGQALKAVRAVSSYEEISLNVNNADYTDQTRIRLKEDALATYEQNADGIKILSSMNQVPQLYTEASGSCSGISCNSLPMNTSQVDLKLRTGKAGAYTFRLADKNKLGTVKKVILVDDVEKVNTDLMQVESYTYTNSTATTTTTSRFHLLLSREAITGLTNAGNNAVSVKTDGKHVSLTGLEGDAQVNFYSAIGKLLFQFNNVNNTNVLDINIQGMYVVDINTATQHARVKVLINNK